MIVGVGLASGIDVEGDIVADGASVYVALVIDFGVELGTNAGDGTQPERTKT